MTKQSEVPNYKTDLFFGLSDQWIETAEDEITHYHDVGSGVPIVFLHGSGAGVSAAANWWKNLPQISQVGRCIALDLIGFGQSVTGKQTEYGIREWGNQVVRMLDRLGIDKTWLVGNSLGGWIALQLVIDHPDRIIGVVSMGTGGAPMNESLKKVTQQGLSQDGVRTTLEKFVVDKSLVTDELVELRYQSALNDSASERFGKVVAARDRDRVELPLDGKSLNSLTLPILLVHGLQDAIIPVSRTWELLEKIPSSDAHLFNNCGHWSQVERAAEFNELVGGYIRMHTPE